MRVVPSLLLLAILLPASAFAGVNLRVLCRDGVCRFAFACPLCTFEDPGCKAKCSDEPRYVGVRLAVGRARVVRLPAVDVELLLRCR
jgi:hypothetical protein